ncbi:Serine/threonine-protein phosphatase 7 long form homolog [Linum perenne]
MSYVGRTEDYDVEVDHLWRVVTPILCIDYVAWHHPDHCVRKFGFEQCVPQDAEPASRVEQLLVTYLRASMQDWAARYREWPKKLLKVMVVLVCSELRRGCGSSGGDSGRGGGGTTDRYMGDELMMPTMHQGAVPAK